MSKFRNLPDENPFGESGSSAAPSTTPHSQSNSGGANQNQASSSNSSQVASSSRTAESLSDHIGTLPTYKNRFRNVKVELIHKIEPSQDLDVNDALLLPSSTREDGVICCGEDKSVRVYLRRESGIFWPSVCSYASCAVSCMTFNAETRRLFCGLDNGCLNEYLLSQDCNSLPLKKQVTHSHGKRITCVKFSLRCEWLLSCSKDKIFAWHCSESGDKIGSFILENPLVSLDFDEGSRHVFIGDSVGTISMYRLQDGGNRQTITSFTGHSAPINALVWDSLGGTLFSASDDYQVVEWDIAGKRGTAYELSAHTNRVTSLAFAATKKLLFTASEDCKFGAWDIAKGIRVETKPWLEADSCQICTTPFIWNVKEMWERRCVGSRQHHCRCCGRAVCDSCSANKSTLPPLGFETEVRMCKECYNDRIKNVSDSAKDKLLQPLAFFHDSRHPIRKIDIDESPSRRRMLTLGKDRVIKLWDISQVFEAALARE